MSDQNDGLGGSYLLDPTTGQRTLVERTGSAPLCDVPTEIATPEPATAGRKAVKTVAQ